MIIEAAPEVLPSRSEASLKSQGQIWPDDSATGRVTEPKENKPVLP